MPIDNVPSRISPDAIVEAIFELRFAHADLPEVFLGQLLSSSSLIGLRPVRLPQADIPYSARESDPQIRFQPAYQLEAGNELIRVGPASLSFHVLTPYCGWEKFRARAEEIVRGAWASCGEPTLERCGLRYINALTSTKHGIESAADLNLSVSIAGESLSDLSVSYLAEDNQTTETMVRIASAKEVQGQLPEHTTFAVDVDVRTIGDIGRWKLEEIVAWLDQAREIKNKHFFRLLPARIVETLKVQ